MEKIKWCPNFKKSSKPLCEKYRLILLLSNCGKILEQLIYNWKIAFFTQNELISHNQSGVKLEDSYIKQLFCITHDFHQLFDNGHYTRDVFLDISKAFDKIWQNGIRDIPLYIINNFLIQNKEFV